MNRLAASAFALLAMSPLAAARAADAVAIDQSGSYESTVAVQIDGQTTYRSHPIDQRSWEILSMVAGRTGLSGNAANAWQSGTGNSAAVVQTGSHDISFTSQQGSGNRAATVQSGAYDLSFVGQQGTNGIVAVDQSGNHDVAFDLQFSQPLPFTFMGGAAVNPPGTMRRTNAPLRPSRPAFAWRNTVQP